MELDVHEVDSSSKAEKIQGQEMGRADVVAGEERNGVLLGHRHVETERRLERTLFPKVILPWVNSTVEPKGKLVVPFEDFLRFKQHREGFYNMCGSGDRSRRILICSRASTILRLLLRIVMDE